MSLFQEKFEITKDLHTHFLEMADEIQMIALKVGVKITPYRSSKLPHFSKLNEKKKLQALKVLSHQRDFLQMATLENLEPNSPKLVWRALAKMGMVPQPDIFDKLTSEDTVEVYHGDGTTSFKNLVFFEFISMSLEELFCLTWPAQLKANPKMMLFFLEINAKMALGAFDKTFTPRFNRYHIREKLGEERTFYIHLKWLSPIYYQGERKALIFVNRSSFANNPENL